MAFIAALRALATDPAARGLDDDAAVLEIGGESLVLTHDMMVCGVHFLPGQDPADVAWKLVATNMSDLAAKGAVPIGVLLGYQLSAGTERFLAGLGEALAHYGAPLLGGDTVGGAGPQTLGLTALGRATHRPVPTRSGARPGDTVWVTGAVGGAMIGLEALRADPAADPATTLRYRRPQARLAEGRVLAPQVSAMMDLSDGLLLDALRLARASRVTVTLESGAVPLDCPEPRRAEALRWGDDYELLFTLPAGCPCPVPATRIGTVQDGAPGRLLVDGIDQGEAAGLGFVHR
nr:thiamine-phosphate kinase [Novosphingobium piscinae]